MSIEQQNGDYNLYASAATVYNKTSSAAGEWKLDVRIGDGVKNLHTDAASLTVTAVVDGETLSGDSAIVSKGITVLRARCRVDSFNIASGKVVTITLKSNNSNDTDVDVTVVPRRCAPTFTEMTTAFTEIKGATWSDSTDTLEHIRDKLPTNLEDLSVTNTTGRVDIGLWLGIAPLALSSQQVQSVVPNAQKVDVNTFKTQSVTCGAGVTISPNVGTTQPINFDGTGAAAYIKSGLYGILSTTLTETSGWLAAGFKKLFNVATPALTAESVNQTGDSYDIVNDKLSGVSVQVASQAEVVAIQNNTRVRVIIPTVIERPDAGSTVYRLDLYIYDQAGGMEAPDSLPAITAVNQAGTDRNANLGTVTLASTGHYFVTYTVASGHDIEQIRFEWSIVEGSATRLHGGLSQIVDTTAIDFTVADRTALNDIPTTAEFEARTLMTANYALSSICTEIRLSELNAANLPADIDVIRASVETIDGVSAARAFRAMLALVVGKFSVVNNGDGTQTATMYAQDGTTVAATVTYESTGERTITSIGS